MKTPLKRLTLFIYLLLFFLMAKAEETSIKRQFEFLKIPLGNATMVGDSKILLKSIGDVSCSTLINTVFWYGACKTMTAASDLTSSQIKCSQLAPLMAATETTLAGTVSPWPLEPTWWQPLLLNGVVLSAYSGCRGDRYIQNAITATMAYLVAEALSRTVASGVSSFILKQMAISNVNVLLYYIFEYMSFSIATGVLVGSDIYETLILNNTNHDDAALISSISAFFTSAVAVNYSLATAGANSTISLIFAALLAGIITHTGTGALTGAAASAFSGAAAIAGTTLGTGATAVIETMLIFAGASASASLTFKVDRLAQSDPYLATAAAMAMATTLTLINSLSCYAVYGYSLEQSLSELSQILLKKFYAPIEYFSNSFH